MVAAGLRPILNMDEFTLWVVYQDQLVLLNQKNFTVVDSSYFENKYYLVRPEKAEELTGFGEIVFSHKDDYVIKVNTSGEQQLWKSGFRLKRLGNIIKIRPLPEKKESSSFFIGKNPQIVDMLAQVDSLNYLGYIRRLQNFKTRYSTTDSCQKAAEYLWSVYDSFGLAPVYQKFMEEYAYAPNVIATKTGVTEPEVQVIVCGHFDAACSGGFDPDTIAPGADDNASGAAAAVELARICKEYQFERTLKFIDFAGEEQGLYGSTAYAESVAWKGDSILAVFNLDMIGYVDGPESLKVYGDSSSQGLVDTFITYAQTYVPDLKTEYEIGYFPFSDHASFEYQGYDAILGIERWSNIYYHSPGDTIGGGFNSLSFATKVLKAVLAAAASLAKPIPGAVAEGQSLPEFGPSVRIEPNPNSGKFFLQYVLPKPGKVNIEIYNAAGQRIVKVFRGEVNGGSNRLACDAHPLPAGVYFLTIKGDGFSLTRRFVCVG